MSFNKLLYLFALRVLGIGISWQSRRGINLNEEKFLRRFRAAIDGGVVLDVGANVGRFASAVRYYCPRSRIICFEPHPVAYDYLKSNSDIETHNIALGDQSTQAILYERRGTCLSTVASLSQDSLDMFGGSGQQYDVVVETLDNFCRHHDIDRITLLKIDTEGFDLHVLRGARGMLRRGAIDMIEFEFVPACISTKINMRDFFKALDHYNIYRLALNGNLISLSPYDYRFCEVYVTQHLVAMRRESR